MSAFSLQIHYHMHQFILKELVLALKLQVEPRNLNELFLKIFQQKIRIRSYLFNKTLEVWFKKLSLILSFLLLFS